MLAAAAFARRVIGKPWAAGAQGPEAFDCWGLARACQSALFGRELPIVAVDPANARAVMRAIAGHELRRDWEEVPVAGHGDLVTLAHHTQPDHIGVWLALDRGKILHSTQGGGVSFDKLSMLKATGWGGIHFHRFAGPT